MIHVLIAGNKENQLSGLLKGLAQQEDIKLHLAATMTDAIDIISTPGVDLLVADENLYNITGLKFVEKVIKMSPMTNCALVSSLSPNEFHEESEGLGVLMQLPTGAGEDMAIPLINRLKEVLNITGKISLGRKGDIDR